MHGRFNTSDGIAYPGDMQALTQVFDRICLENGFAKGSPEAEDVGRAAMALFSAGVHDKAEIVASLTEHIKRKIG